jgi:hypothetical protein
MIGIKRPSTDLDSITATSIAVDPNKTVVTHPTQEVTEQEAVSTFSTSSETSAVVNHYIHQTTSVPQTTSVSYVGDVNTYAFVRKQKIDFVSYNMRPNRRVYPFFDSKDVTRLIQAPNIIELDNSSAFYGIAPFAIKNHNEITANSTVPAIVSQIDTSRDIVYFDASGDTFAYVYHNEKTATGNTRLYVSEIIRNNTNVAITAGTRVYKWATGGPGSNPSGPGIGLYYFYQLAANVVTYQHQSGIMAFDTTVPNYTSTSNVYYTATANTYTTANTMFNMKVVTLAYDASDEDEYYTGNTITLINAYVPGEICEIVSYNGDSKIAVVEPGFLGGIGVDEELIYTIGDSRSAEEEVAKDRYANNALYTTSKGFFSGSLYIPSPWKPGGFNFRVGEKLFKITDSPNNNSSDATTISEYIYNTFGISISKGQLNINYFSNETVTTGGDLPSYGSLSRLSPIQNPTTSGDIIEVDDTTEFLGQSPIRSVKTNPMAQSFYVSEIDYPRGFYIPYIDLFFANKGTLGIELQIRPIVNGYPDAKNILPNAVAFMQAEDVNETPLPNVNDPESYTRFTFKSPVYVMPGQEYCFVLSTNDFEYDVYVSELGERTIGTNRLVSEQPYLGSLFKSQNSSTYDAIQSEDLMFVIHKCQFVNSGFIEFHEEKSNSPAKELFNYYYNGNTTMDTFEVQSNIIKLPGTDVGFSYKATSIADNTLDAEFSTIKPDSRVILMNRKKIISSTFPTESFKTRIDLSTTNRDISPIIFKSQIQLYTGAVLINDLELRAPLVSVANSGSGYTYSNTSIAITSNGSGSGANATIIVPFEDYSTGRIDSLLFDYSGQSYYDDIKVTVTGTGSGANVSIKSETDPSGGPGLAKYISKTVTLAPEFDAGDLRVFVTAAKPQGSEILVYYKVNNPYDEDDIANKNWVRMERVTGKIEYSSVLEPIEYEYRPSLSSNNIVYSTSTATFDSFNQFKIKIVLASVSTSLAEIPYVYDMRAVALPADSY